MFPFAFNIFIRLLYFSITAFVLIYSDLGLLYNRLKNKAKQRKKGLGFSYSVFMYEFIYLLFMPLIFQNTSMAHNANILEECLKILNGQGHDYVFDICILLL